MPGPDSGAVVARHLTRRDLLALGVLGGIWGATFPVVRWGVQGGSSPFLLVAIDLLIAFVAMVGLALARRRPRPPAPALFVSVGLGVLLIGGINLLLFWGVRFATGGLAAILFATAPMISFAASYGVGHRERLSGRAGLALVVGLAGVVILGLATPGTGLSSNPWGLVALLGGAVCQGVGAVLVARLRPEGESDWGQAMQFAGGAIAGLLAVGLLGAPLALSGGVPTGASIAFVALLTGVVGYTLYFGLIRRVGPTRANLVTYVNPLVALAVGAFALAEPVTGGELAGLALVLVSLALLPSRPAT